MKFFINEHKFAKLIESIQNTPLSEIIAKLNEYSAKLEYSRFGSFEGFVKLNTYLKANFGDIIGDGSSRLVYEIDDCLCLKLAKNKKGIQQNIEEISTFEKYKKFSIFTKIFYKDENNLWIICEKALPIQDSDFAKVFGLGKDTFGQYEDLHDNLYFIDYKNYMDKESNPNKIFDSFVKWCDDERNGNNELKHTEQERHISVLRDKIKEYENDSWGALIAQGYEKQIMEHEKILKNLEKENRMYRNLIQNNRFLSEFYDFITLSDTLAGDISGNNLGLVQRNGEPCVVLLDYGITQKLYNSYYK